MPSDSGGRLMQCRDRLSWNLQEDAGEAHMVPVGALSWCVTPARLRHAPKRGAFVCGCEVVGHSRSCCCPALCLAPET